VSAAHHRERVLAYLSGFRGLLMNLQEHMARVHGGTPCDLRVESLRGSLGPLLASLGSPTVEVNPLFASTGR
jgi:hypothetical protein